MRASLFVVFALLPALAFADEPSGYERRVRPHVQERPSERLFQQDRDSVNASDALDELLDELAAEARRPAHHFGHEWKVGDCVVWDNRATMHRVDVDYPMGEKRIMQRVLIEGDKPF